MKATSFILVAAFVTAPLCAQEIIKAADIEKQMGLTPAPAAAAPKTRSFRPGGAGDAAAAPAANPGRVVQRAAVASGATLTRAKTRGVSVVELDDASGRVSVPVIENAQASFKNILFEKDSTQLADAASAAQIAEIAQVMLKWPDRRFVVEGHTCDLGSDWHNERLSVARSAAVEASLLGAGVRPEQIVALGFGETDPVSRVAASAPASDPWAESLRRQNRRVVIRLQAPGAAAASAHPGGWGR